MSKIKLIENIAGSITKSNLMKVGLGTSINLFLERQNPTEHSCSMLMRTCMGQVKAADVVGTCRGMYRVSRGYDNRPTLYAVYDQSLYLVNKDNTMDFIGRIPSTGTECHMCETAGYGSAHPHLIVVDGSAVYAVNTGLSVGDQQNDFRTIKLPLRANTTDTLISPTHCAYLYGYLVVNDAGTDAFYTSYQYPFEVTDTEDPEFYQDRADFVDWWMSLTDAERTAYKNGEVEDAYYDRWKNFIDGTADDTPEKYDLFRVDTVQFAKYGFVTYSEWCPDNTIALCSNGSKLYTFGERSWQAFSYNDDKNNPFSSPDNAAGNIGVKAPNSISMLGHTALWLGSSDIGDNGVFMINDTQIKRVSTQDIEREITQIKNPENAYSSIWQEHQHQFYSITFEDSQRTFVYDITEDAWHYRASYDDSSRLTFWRYNHVTFAYGKQYCGTKNALCYMDENKYTEHDDRVILKQRRGGVLTSNDCPFYIDSAEIICNAGQHSFDNYNKLIHDNYDQDFNPRISIRYCWDGGNWSDYEDLYLGKIGQYDYSVTSWHLGMGSYFTLEISTTEPVPFAIENLKIAFSPCSNFI